MKRCLSDGNESLTRALKQQLFLCFYLEAFICAGVHFFFRTFFLRHRAIVTELGKLGAEVEEGRDYCVITPPKAVKPGVAIDTYDDHRMVRQSNKATGPSCLHESLAQSDT